MGVYISVNKSCELTKGEKDVLDKLKTVYKESDDDVYIYSQYVLATKRADFIIIDSQRGISILEVKDWSEQYIKYSDRRKVVLNDYECDNPNIQVQKYKSILSSGIATRDFDIDCDEINTVVIYTNLNENIKDNEKLKYLITDKNIILFKSDLDNFNIDRLFNEKVRYSKNDIKQIRVSLFPEIEIVNSESDDVITDVKALDFEQEEFAKKIPVGHYMVTGIPGSGKTVMLLARAIYLVKENPNWKVLILTYNKSLRNKLISRLEKTTEIFRNDINNKDVNLENIEVLTFHQLTYYLTNGMRKPYGVDNPTWFNTTVVEYASEKAKPIYDTVLIDEYQDFRMNWIELAIKACKEHTDNNGKIFKNIFLAGDRLQSIYNSKEVSWKSIGLNMQGRSKLLKTSYRSAKQHMVVALDFLRNNASLRDEVNKFYTDDSENNDINSLNDGSIEFIIGNFKSIGDKIIELKQQGYKNEDLLILADNKNTCEKIKESCSFNIRHQMAYVKDLDARDMNNSIILTTYHSAKGLEAKIVFLTTMDGIYNGDEDNDILKRKTVYVGMTRASEKLFIHGKSEYDGELMTELKGIILRERANELKDIK